MYKPAKVTIVAKETATPTVWESLSSSLKSLGSGAIEVFIVAGPAASPGGKCSSKCSDGRLRLGRGRSISRRRASCVRHRAIERNFRKRW